MDIEQSKTIAAYGGLLLGLINLFLYLYKEYFRKPKLMVNVRAAYIRAVETDLFDIQIDVELVSLGGSSYIKEILLNNEIPIFDPVHGKSKRTIYRAINYPGYCSIDKDPDTFNDLYIELFQNSFTVSNTKIDDKEYRNISIIDRVEIERHMDGAWDWPRSNWQLLVSSSTKKVCVPFDFVVHNSNKLNCYCQ
jgi:hypothetical protein